MNKHKGNALVVIELREGLVYTPIVRKCDIGSATPFARGTLMARTAIVKFGKETTQECVSLEICEILLIIREAQ